MVAPGKDINKEEETATEEFEQKISYTINFDHYLENLSTDFAAAYACIVKDVPPEAQNQYYALVFKNSFSVQHDLVDFLKVLNRGQSIVTQIMDEAVVKVPKSGDECIALVLEKPEGKTLRELFTDRPIPEKMMAQNFIPVMTKTLALLSERGFCHGTLNIDNVYYSPDTDKLTLAECFSTPPGYLQPVRCEPQERAICSPLAKGAHDSISDYYSFGILLYFLLTGREAFRDLKDEQIIDLRYVTGSIDHLLGRLKISALLHDLMRGLLADRLDKRWSRPQMDNWLKNRSNQMSMHSSKDAARSFPYAGKEYFSLNYLAYILHKDRKTAREMLRVNELARWVQHNVTNPEVNDRFETLTFLNKSGDGMALTDIEISKVVTSLDANGPVRFGDLSVNVDGIGSMISYSYATEDNEMLQQVGNMFNRGILEHWLLQASEKDDVEDSRVQSLDWSPKKVLRLVKMTTPGFGMERVLYETNPRLSCQSKMLSKFYTPDIAALLHALDKVARDNPNRDPVDRHIAAFIMAKEDMRDELTIKNSADNLSFSKSNEVFSIALLATAQQYARVPNLNNLCGWLVDRLLVQINTLNSVLIREDVKRKLLKMAKEGSIVAINHFLNTDDFLRRDANGMKQARTYHYELEKQIKILSSAEANERLAYEYGLRVAVIISYLVCVATLFYLLAGL